ncbi:MAG: pseudouridine synthase [Pirellula sp.]
MPVDGGAHIESQYLEETDDFIVDSISRPLQIVFRDENYVAVFKPAGMVVHRGKLSPAHEPVLLQTLRDQLDRLVYPVHRLDQPTAGLILFALNGSAAGRMVESFTNRSVSKYYQALVRGYAPRDGLIDKPLSENSWAKLPGECTDDETAQTASTRYSVLARYQVPWRVSDSEPTRFSLLEVQPLTGRWHQIRRHLNHIACPVIGDHRHGDHGYNQMVFERLGVYRMLLTAMRLDFRHPYTGELQSIVVRRGTQFDRLMSMLERWRVEEI